MLRDNLLEKWLVSNRQKLESLGYYVSELNDENGSCYSVNIDSDKLVGTICYWSPARFEFQFNQISDGSVIILEEKEFNSIGSLNIFFNTLPI
jgi:hypothetical protein